MELITPNKLFDTLRDNSPASLCTLHWANPQVIQAVVSYASETSDTPARVDEVLQRCQLNQEARQRIIDLRQERDREPVADPDAAVAGPSQPEADQPQPEPQQQQEDRPAEPEKLSAPQGDEEGEQ